MIYEIRTYTLKPGSLAEVEKRFGEAYEYRKKYSPLAAFWHTEIGPLNEIIHIWGYKDLAERARIRAEAAKDANWPPKIREFIVEMDVGDRGRRSRSSPTSRRARWARSSRSATTRSRRARCPARRRAGRPSIGERIKLSPLVLAGGVEFGDANGFVHIWAYKSMDQRLARSGTRRARRACGRRRAAATR